jgi:S-adenosylmethionine decarboxylase
MEHNLKPGPRETVQEVTTWVDLAPDICRQRLIIEGTLKNVFLPENMTRYCHEIASVLNMTEVTTPICNHDPDYGWCAYTHWKESGMHIYAWDKRTPKFFSIDLYTCKPFAVMTAVDYTTEFFGRDLIELIWRD